MGGLFRVAGGANGSGGPKPSGDGFLVAARSTTPYVSPEVMDLQERFSVAEPAVRIIPMMILVTGPTFPRRVS